MRLSIVFLLTFFIPYFPAYAAKEDSLETLLKKEIPDSVRIDVLNNLSLKLRNTDISRSEQLAHEAIRLSEKNKDRKSEARSMHTLATIYYLTANYAEGLKYYLSSVKIREELGDSANLAKGYNNIALIHFEQRNYDESLRFHEKSIAIKLKRNDLQGLASSYGNVGNIYHHLGSEASKKNEAKLADSLFTVASEYQNKALAIQQKLVAGNSSDPAYQLGLAGTYNNLGNISYERSILRNDDVLLQEARLYHEKALILQQMFGDQRGLSHSHINLASIFERTGEYDKVIREYEQALEIAGKLNFHEEMKVTYFGLSSAYEKKGDFRKSLEYYKLYSSEKDSILDIAKQEQIAEMQEKFNAKDKEREIQLLNKNRKIAEAELEKQHVVKRSFLIGLVLAIILIIMVVALLAIIWNRYKLKTKTSYKLEEQNRIIVRKNKEITDSITYARRIQLALLPPEHQINKVIPDSFIIYKPKDIVSGDFYWIEEWGRKILIAVADCTGHGVPGAFMSVVGYNMLNQAVNVYGMDKPAVILNHMNKWLYKILHQNTEEPTVKDGMDICLISIDKETKRLEYAGAYNPLWILRSGKLTNLKADKFPVGVHINDEHNIFTTREMQLEKGDQLYLFTDGFADQFGGPEGKKFKYRQLRDLIEAVAGKSMKEQGRHLENVFENWRGDTEQVDDICVLGIRI